MAESLNYQKLTAAVARWIDEGRTHQRGAALLNVHADRIDGYLADLHASALHDREPPVHLVGLTAIDLICAAGDLRSAAASLCRVAA
jgi:hypothetical protein